MPKRLTSEEAFAKWLKEYEARKAVTTNEAGRALLELAWNAGRSHGYDEGYDEGQADEANSRD